MTQMTSCCHKLLPVDHLSLDAMLTFSVGWMLSTHSPPQKWRNMVAFTMLSTKGAATLREARMIVSAFSTRGFRLQALKTARD